MSDDDPVTAVLGGGGFTGIDSKKTEVERVEEEAMISELVELVEKRDKLMWALHEVYKLVYDKLHLRIPERVVGKMAESVGP